MNAEKLPATGAGNRNEGALKIMLRRAIAAATYGAASCAVLTPLFITLLFDRRSTSATDFYSVFIEIPLWLMDIALIALPVTATCGFVFGFIGSLSISFMSLTRTRRGMVIAASAAGGVLGSISPILLRVIPPQDSIVDPLKIPFAVFVLIGISCGSSWALLESFKTRTKFGFWNSNPNETADL